MRRTVYGVKPFIFQSEIDPEKDSILTVAWSPYGLGEDALANDGDHLNKLIEKVALMDEEIRNKEDNIRTLNSQLDKIQNSRSYRIGLAVTYVPKLIRDFFKRLLNK